MHSKIGRDCPAYESVLDSAVHRPDHRRRATGETSRFQGEDREFEETASNGRYIQSRIKNKESLLSLDRKDDLDDQADEDSNQDTYSYSNDQTAIADDNNSYDCASSVSSASTYRQKFKNSFWSNQNKIMRHILIALIIYI